MSHYATPFLVVNLGCEMIYVIDQRLKAQKITQDKAEKVLTDIATVLLHKKLLDELFIPQPVAPHAVIRKLLQDISASSIMKLDAYSMAKLWELMTMIFKWQISVATNTNIFDITFRHLKCLATLLPIFFPYGIVQHAIKMFEILTHRLNPDDYRALNNTMILWLSEYHSKISILIRLGFQKKDGSFCVPASIKQGIIENVGENIYNHDIKNLAEIPCIETDEISCMLSQIAEQCSSKESIIEIELPIEIGEQNPNKKKLEISTYTKFKNIDTNVKQKSDDLLFKPQVPKSAQEDLINMLGGDEFQIK